MEGLSINVSPRVFYTLSDAAAHWNCAVADIAGWAAAGKHTGSKRERFAAVFCEIRRRDVLGQGAASHGKCEGWRSSEGLFMVRSP